jgi:hypothetical protein
MTKRFATVAATLILVLVVILAPLSSLASGLAHAPDVPTDETAPAQRLEDLDTFVLAHDYLVAGIALRGPLASLHDMLGALYGDGEGGPTLSITYVARAADGSEQVLVLDTFADLAAFLSGREAARMAMAHEIIRRGNRALASAYALRGAGCDALDLPMGRVHVERQDLDYRLLDEDGAPVALAVAVADTLTLVSLSESGAVLSGEMDNEAATVRHTGSSCALTLTPLDRIAEAHD